MGNYGVTVHHDADVDGHRLALDRAGSGIYVLDLEPKAGEDTGDDGVHLYLTAEQLISLGASIQAEIKAQALI